MLLDRGGGQLAGELLDVGGDEEGLELSEREASPLAPAEEAAGRLDVGLPGVGVADLGGEELDEPSTRPLAGLVDDGGEVEGGAGEAQRSARPADESGGEVSHSEEYTPLFCVR